MGRASSIGHLDLLLLAALAQGEGHGYAVISRIRKQSEGQFDLLEGTVYPVLHRLEEERLLSSRWAVEGGRRRRTYALTAAGRKALAVKRSEWLSFARGMHAMLGATA
jgi:DNA-binding PadR family transcriptional regulator